MGFTNIYSVAKYQKTQKGDFFQKKSHNAKKNRKGKPFSLVQVKKVKNERGDPYALISADRTWPYRSSFSSFDCKESGPIRVRL